MEKKKMENMIYDKKIENVDRGMKKLFKFGFGVGVVTIIYIAGALTWRLVSKSKEGTMKPIETTIESTTETIEETNLVDQLISNVQEEEEKTFEKGEHYICVRIPHHSKYFGMNNPDENDELEVFAINNIPEGYEIYSITPYTSKVGSGSSTAGYDIWLVNNKRVKVKATYNNQTKQHGYYTVGEVVAEEKQLTK